MTKDKKKAKIRSNECEIEKIQVKKNMQGRSEKTEENNDKHDKRKRRRQR